MAVMLTESFRVVRGNSRVGKAITCEQSGRKESGQRHNTQKCQVLINPDRNSPVIGKTVNRSINRMTGMHMRETGQRDRNYPVTEVVTRRKIFVF